MELSKSFFEDEVRDGFYVTSDMKHAWAAQLEVLNDVDKACRENGIQYFAEWGTLLGAVRHHGFIPWDDDMDICMKRPDYNRFLQIADQIMPEGYKIFNISSDEDNDNMLTRIINGRAINFEKTHLEKFHGFPYVSGIDIFPLDFIAPNREDDDFQCELISIVNSVAKFIRTFQENEESINEENLQELNLRINQIEELCGVEIDRDKDLAQQLNVLVDRLCGLYTEEEAEYVTIMTIWAEERQYKLPKEYYSKTVRLPFENITIPVPYSYDAILKKKYGDYMKLVHTWDSHDYPFYDRQKKLLKDNGVVFNEFCDTYEDYINYKKQVNGIRKIRNAIREKNINHETAVFMVYKAEYWDMLDGLFREYEKRKEQEIVVIPLRYYYKNIDGTVEECASDAVLPEYVQKYINSDYNIEEENPETIIIQNPYDGYNGSVTIHPRYYSKNLAIHTNKLIYMPYFVTEEINPMDMRAYISMDAYVTMPGVVYADEVMLQSEANKELYVKKLTEFFGEESKKEWEDKINGRGALYIEKKDPVLKYNIMPSGWKNMALKNDGSYRKIILYFISTNGVLEHKRKMFGKIRRSMDVFTEYQSDVMPLLAFEGNMEDILELEDVMLLMDYKTILRKYEKNIVRPDMLKRAVDACDAFYGEAGAEAQMCRNQGKPVMIEDVDI